MDLFVETVYEKLGQMVLFKTFETEVVQDFDAILFTTENNKLYSGIGSFEDIYLQNFLSQGQFSVNDADYVINQSCIQIICKYVSSFSCFFTCIFLPYCFSCVDEAVIG